MRQQCEPAEAGTANGCTRHGFTLLEVLVALSLSLLLIAAVYSGLNLYWRYSAAGQADVEQSQLARALLRRIELDVRSVMYRPPPAAASTQSSTSSGGTSSGASGNSGSNSSGGGNNSGSTGSNTGGARGATVSRSAPNSPGGNAAAGGTGGSSSSGTSGASNSGQSTDTEATTPDDAYGTSTTGLFGNATTLLMHVSKPGNEQMALRLAMTGNQQTRISDLATVAYFVSGTATGTLQNFASGPGLARLEGDRLALSMADQQSNTTTMAGHTEILAPEVTALRFMYFDGFRWRNDWDSKVLGGLPRAIEVEIALQPPAGNARQGLQRASSAPSVYRLVIAVPLAKPIDSATILAQ
ncbi:MAG: prepilin-type N-terminal cleavage/methylation domain-containing protein [Deltaproteobacteria bacterium]